MYNKTKYKDNYDRCSGKQVTFLCGSATVMRNALSRATDAAKEVCAHENGPYGDERMLLLGRCVSFFVNYRERSKTRPKGEERKGR